jgi:glycosyltransferase involved in cell wall biosynthesis
MGPLISIITVTFNSEKTIERTLQSVASQTYEHIEHIVIDGASTDGTPSIIEKYKRGIAYFASAPDRGMYDAINKGLRVAKGKIIGLMHSDDIFPHTTVVAEIARQFEDSQVDGIYADAAFFSPTAPEKTVRLYSSAKFSAARLAWGWMPAHPTMYLRKEVYDVLGEFKTDYAIAADYDFVCRLFLRKQLRILYVPRILVKMQTGGISTRGWRAKIRLNHEVVRACRENGISTNILKILSKYPSKIQELFVS